MKRINMAYCTLSKKSSCWVLSSIRYYEKDLIFWLFVMDNTIRLVLKILLPVEYYVLRKRNGQNCVINVDEAVGGKLLIIWNN